MMNFSNVIFIGASTWLILCLFLILNDVNGQIYHPDRHNTSVESTWISCHPRQNPNVLRGVSHWIMYDLGDTYPLENTHLWNLNTPEFLANGMKELAIDLSDNGKDWMEASVFQASQANGSGFYTGEPGPDLTGHEARFVLLTILENYGGPCSGFGELKIEISEKVVPAELVDLSITCNEETGITIQWTVKSGTATEGYSILKSADGLIWEQVGFINSSNNNIEVTYQYTDASVINGIHFYKIIQKDLDGSTTSFPTLQVNCNLSSSYISITPNPSVSNSIIQYLAEGTENIEIRIHSIAGKLVHNQPQNPAMEMLTVELDISRWIPGMYIVTIKEGSKISRAKLIKL